MPIINPININDFTSGSLVHNRATATLASANWVDNSGVYTQTLQITNMTSTATVWVSPQYDATTNYTQYYATDQIVPIEQGAGYITFRRYASSSSGDIEINIVWVEQGQAGQKTIILGVNDWVAGSQTKSIPEISISTYVWVSPTDTETDIENYCNSQVYCSNQIDGQLTFTYAGTTPSVDIPVNVAYFDMTAQNSGSNLLVVPATYDATNEKMVFTSHTVADIYNYFHAGTPVKIMMTSSQDTYCFDVTDMYYNGSTYYMTAFCPTVITTSSSITVKGFTDNSLLGTDTEIADTTAAMFAAGAITLV